jgi:hypothetical protein
MQSSPDSRHLFRQMPASDMEVIHQRFPSCPSQFIFHNHLIIRRYITYAVDKAYLGLTVR